MSLKPSITFGAGVGSVLAVLIAALFAGWDWLDNPGGVFRDETGTHWAFVWETGASWFLPLAVPCVVIATGLHALVKRFGGRGRSHSR